MGALQALLSVACPAGQGGLSLNPILERRRRRAVEIHVSFVYIETYPARTAFNEARTQMYVSLQGSIQSRPASSGREPQWEGILITQSSSSPLVVGCLSVGETDWPRAKSKKH
jgi:hypothetical protein